MSHLNDLSVLLDLLTPYISSPPTLDELMKSTQNILPNIINSITSEETVTVCNDENLFLRMENNKKVLNACKRLGIKVTLTESELTQPIPAVFSQIISVLWQLLMLNIKSKIEKVHNDNDIDDVLKQWMVVLMPNEQINTQTTVKLHEIIVSEEKLDSQDNGSPLLSKQETTIFPEVPIEDIKDHQRETDNKETDDNNDVIEEMLMEQEMQNRLKQLENEVNKINQYSSEEEIISRIGLAKETNKRTKDDISSLYVDLSKMRYNVMNEIVKTNLMQKEFNRLLVQKDSEAAHMKHREDLVKDKIERRVVDVEELKKKHNDIIQSVSELEYQIVQLNFKTKDATEKLESAEQLNKDLVKELESKNDGIDALKILLTKSKQKQKENQRDCTRIRKQRKQIEADTMVVKSDKKRYCKGKRMERKKN
ncbi:Coiled-coil domain containing protein [Entamoeba marina]